MFANLPTIEDNADYQAALKALEANDAEYRAVADQEQQAASELGQAQANLVDVSAAVVRGKASQSDLFDARQAVTNAETHLAAHAHARTEIQRERPALEAALRAAHHAAAMRVAEQLLVEERRLLAATIAAAREAAKIEGELERVQEAIMEQFREVPQQTPDMYAPRSPSQERSDDEARSLVLALDPLRSRLSFLSPANLEFMLANMRAAHLIDEEAA